jgi:hypothetical protein
LLILVRSKLGTVPGFIGGCPGCLRAMKLLGFAPQKPGTGCLSTGAAKVVFPIFTG